MEVQKDYPALEKIKEVCDRNSLNMRNIDISQIEDRQMTVVVYFPYNVNPLILDYFINELKKEKEVITAKKIMKNPSKRIGETHES